MKGQMKRKQKENSKEINLKRKNKKQRHILSIKIRLPLWLATRYAQDKMAIFIKHLENAGSLISTRWVFCSC